MKKLLISVLTFLFVFASPISVFATDYNNYCSDTVQYPTEDIPAFSSLINDSSLCSALLYNSLDSTFYFCTTKKYNGIAQAYNFKVENGNLIFYNTGKWAYYYIYKYTPGEGNSWSLVTSGEATHGNHTVCAVSQAKKFKWLWCSITFTYTDDTYVYNVSKVNTGASDYIYANFFDSATGAYLENDVNNDYGSGESGSGSGSATVDMTETNNKLDQIKSLVYDFKSSFDSKISAFQTAVINAIGNVQSVINTMKTDLSGKLTTINTSINNNFTSLQTFLTAKYETLYNVILYGSEEGEQELEEQEMKLNSLETNLGDINSSVSNVSTIINDAGDDVAEYISTFTAFYNGMAAISGLAAILSFGLVIILVKKIIGR